MRKKGFTLIELLIALGIFAALTGFVMANFRKGKQSDDLKLSARIIMSKISKARGMSLVGELTNNSLPSGGYGIYFDLNNPNQIIIFADKDGCGDYDPDEVLPEQTYFLPQKMKMTFLDPTSPLSLSFRPPKPLGFVNARCSDPEGTCSQGVCSKGKLESFSAKAEIYLFHEDSEESKKIYFNSFTGLVNLE